MSDRVRLLSLFTLAFVIRVAWVLGVDRVGFAFNDAWVYHETAISLSEGRGFLPPQGGPSAQWPPGYAAVLGAVYAVMGARPVAGELLNAAIGALTVVLLYVAVRRSFDRATATLAGALLAMMPGPILWTDMLLSESLFTFLFVGLYALLMHARPNWSWAVVIGLIIGLGALVRGEALTWALLVFVLWRRELSWRRLIPRLAAVGAILLATMAPWTIRNYLLMDAFIPLASNSSLTLWVGHNPDATGAQMYPSDDLFDQFSSETRARELETSQYFRREAIDFMISNPLREIELIPLKVISLLRGDSYAFDWINDAPEPPLSSINVQRIGTVADTAWFAVLALTILGALRLGRSTWRVPMMTAIATSLITGLFLYGFLYYGNYRYRLPYEPLMITVAALVLRRTWSALPLLTESPAIETASGSAAGIGRETT